MTEAEADPLVELRELSAALRAHAEWLLATGATGIERSTLVQVPEVEPARIERAPAAGPDTPHRAPVKSSPGIPKSSPGIPHAARPVAPAPIVAPPPVRAVGPTPLDAEEQRRRLAVLSDSIKGCTKCALHAGRTQTVFARGSGASGLCFVGEGPGADEDQQGFPFVGKAGQLLDKMIGAMGFTRDEVYVCNIVKCRPPNNRKPEPEEMTTCMPYLVEQLAILQPQVIVALGATAVQGLFGTNEGITRLRGRWKLYQGQVPVMPTFHPAFLLRDPERKKEVWDDLQAVLRQMGRTVPPRK
jgi:uracil-DNA glycosylase family 4